MNNPEYCYSYPRPAVTVDIIILRNPCESPEILLIQRLNHPFQNHWAIPGGFVDMDETLEQAAIRELEEETGLSEIILNQFKTYSAVNRDPRGRTISVVFMGLAQMESKIMAGDDAKNACWYKINDLPPLAFDHSQIIEEALQTFNV